MLFRCSGLDTGCAKCVSAKFETLTYHETLVLCHVITRFLLA